MISTHLLNKHLELFKTYQNKHQKKSIGNRIPDLLPEEIMLKRDVTQILNAVEKGCHIDPKLC